MRRREYYLNLRCHHEGCKETSFYSYSTQRDYREAVKGGQDRNWMCTRHSDDRLLTTEKLEASKEMTVTFDEKLQKKFFDGRNGFNHGASWKAFAEDFPIGTKIIESIKVILPTDDSK